MKIPRAVTKTRHGLKNKNKLINKFKTGRMLERLEARKYLNL